MQIIQQSRIAKEESLFGTCEGQSYKKVEGMFSFHNILEFYITFKILSKYICTYELTYIE